MKTQSSHEDGRHKTYNYEQTGVIFGYTNELSNLKLKFVLHLPSFDVYRHKYRQIDIATGDSIGTLTDYVDDNLHEFLSHRSLSIKDFTSETIGSVI